MATTGATGPSGMNYGILNDSHKSVLVVSQGSPSMQAPGGQGSEGLHLRDRLSRAFSLIWKSIS